MMFGVEQHGAQRFAVERTHFRAEQLVDQFGAIHLLRGDGLLREPMAESKGRRELHGLGEADPFHFRQFPHAATRQPGQ